MKARHLTTVLEWLHKAGTYFNESSLFSAIEHESLGPSVRTQSLRLES